MLFLGVNVCNLETHLLPAHFTAVHSRQSLQPAKAVLGLNFLSAGGL